MITGSNGSQPEADPPQAEIPPRGILTIFYAVTIETIKIHLNNYKTSKSGCSAVG